MATAANPRGTRANDKAAVAIVGSVGAPPPPTVPAGVEPPCWKFKSPIIIVPIPTIPTPSAPKAPNPLSPPSKGITGWVAALAREGNVA